MRHLTLTLVLVSALLIASPVTAQEAPTLSLDKVVSTWIDRLDQWMLDWSDKLRVEKQGQSDATSSQEAEVNPIEPPDTEATPLLEPNG